VASAPRALLATASPCDVTLPTRGSFSIYMAPAAVGGSHAMEIDQSTASGGVPIVPTRLTVRIHLQEASLQVEEEVMPLSWGGRGFACCGAPTNFWLAGIPEANALRAIVNVTRGRLSALSLKWGACVGHADVDTLRGQCNGFCTMAWLTTRGSYSGTLYSQSDMTLTVPHGHGTEPDKRRAGSWYIGVHAMDGEDVEFSLVAELTAPLYIPPSARCSRITFACANDSARGAWNQQGPPAPPPSRLALAWLQASSPSRLQVAYDQVQNYVSDGIQSKAIPAAVLLVLCILVCWVYRSWRYRSRLRYRVPHDSMDFF